MAKNKILQRKNSKWFWAVGIILIMASFSQGFAKEAVEDVDGQPCINDSDCPCWGEYEEGGPTAYGIGVANCKNNQCDTTYCVDVEPVGEWFKEKPWNWVKNNVVAALGLIAVAIGLLAWPKQ